MNRYYSCKEFFKNSHVNTITFHSIYTLKTLSRGPSPFVNARRMEILDITVFTLSMARRISDWGVSQEPSLSDHRQIRFRLEGVSVVQTHRKPRDTNWTKYCDVLKQNLDSWECASIRQSIVHS